MNPLGHCIVALRTQPLCSALNCGLLFRLRTDTQTHIPYTQYTMISKKQGPDTSLSTDKKQTTNTRKTKQNQNSKTILRVQCVLVPCVPHAPPPSQRVVVAAVASQSVPPRAHAAHPQPANRAHSAAIAGNAETSCKRIQIRTHNQYMQHQTREYKYVFVA